MTEYTDIGEVRAGAAIAQFALVKLDGSTPKKLVVTAANTDVPFGALQGSTSADGDYVTARLSGRTKAIAGGAIGIGATLMPAAAGKVVAHTGVNTRCGRYIGTATAADGDIIDIILFDHPFAGDLA